MTPIEVHPDLEALYEAHRNLSTKQEAAVEAEAAARGRLSLLDDDRARGRKVSHIEYRDALDQWRSARQALEAIADALGANARRRGEIFKARPVAR